MIQQMPMSFWEKLPTPFFVLAPMADVTDGPFRQIIAQHSAHTRADGSVGGPDVMWTEFVSADGLVRATPEGKEKLLADLMYTPAERPIVAQLFSSNEDHMEQAARLCLSLGFDGVDINMGCPDRSIEKQGCGSAMIKNPDVAVRIIAAAKRGARSSDADGIPVSVKTRLGYNTDQLEEWLPILLKAEPAAITLHARTRKEMSNVPARWERIARAVEIRNELQGTGTKRTRIIGNGDALSMQDAEDKVARTGADGVMLGRAIFGNPWLFLRDATKDNIPFAERLAVLVAHTALFEKLLPFKSFALMKKHYKAYIKDFDGAHELRIRLMEEETAAGVEAVVADFLATTTLPTIFPAENK